jgi:hypothetical protein
MLPVRLVIASLGAVAALTGTAARADTINATLSATYFEVADNSGDPDFTVSNTPNVVVSNTPNVVVSNTPNVIAGSALGPIGFPVATGGVNDNNATTGEATWWSPSMNSNVVQTGTGTVSLPYSSTMYAPNSTGSNDATFYETAILSGTFSLASASTIGFVLGSDDDSFIYIDGVLIGQNPGAHAVSTVDFTSGILSAGSHTVAVF